MDNKHTQNASIGTVDENSRTMSGVLEQTSDEKTTKTLGYNEMVDILDEDIDEDDLDDDFSWLNSERNDEVEDDKDDDDEEDDDEEDNEFNSILEDYINGKESIYNHKENKIHEIDMEELKLQKLGKRNYLLPECTEPVLMCSSISLSIDDSSDPSATLYGQPFSLKYSSNVTEYTFTLNNARKTTNDKCYLYVYECDNCEPILKTEIEFFPLKECATVTIPNSHLFAGNYILLFDKVGADNYRFDLFGKSIVFPFCSYDESLTYITDVTSVDGKINKERTEVKLNLKFQKAIPEVYGFNLKLYNCNFNLVAETSNTAWNYNFMRCRKIFDFTAISDIPLIGKHFAILNIGEYPIHCIYLDIKKDGMEIEKSVPCKINMPEHLIATRLEDYDHWKTLREKKGFGNIKSFFLRMEMHDYFNELRKGRGLSLMKINRNVIYYGSGSSEECEILEKALYALKKISTVESADCITLTEAKTAYDPYEEATNLLGDTRDKVVILYNISALLNGSSVVVNKLLNALKKDEDHSICLIGKESEIEQLFQAFPGLSEYFPKANTLDRYSFTANDFTRHCINALKDNDLIPTAAATKKIDEAIETAFANGFLFGWTLKDVEKFTHRHIIDNYYSRATKELGEILIPSRTWFSKIEEKDIDTSVLTNRSASPFEESIKELNAMVGLEDIKSSITAAFNRIRVSEERKRLGLKVNNDNCNHMLFTGNPGTGKTTVAKMVGKIYHSLGLLSKGEVICADRSNIVGRYIGETERNMQRLLNEAKGNVLFIDEAYTLCDTLDDRKDFGYRAIECLLTVLAQKDSDIIVIFAGYEKEILRMMESNQGLQGRFPYKFNFKDYNSDELTQIALNLITEEEYKLTPEAEELLRSTIADTVKRKSKSFSNARWIEQYVNKGIKHAQNDRLAQMSHIPSADLYSRIEAEDVRTAFEKYRPQNEVQHRTIGFRA